MDASMLDRRLPLVENADLEGRVVLVRVDHNVAKKGEIKDPYRIDATLGTIFTIVRKGGFPILMTHVGRPRDKKTGTIETGPKTSVAPIVTYLERKLYADILTPEFPADPEAGIQNIDDSIRPMIDRLKARQAAMIYLPNTRWFEGEQAKGEARERLADQLAGVADVYVNDAFGSWQPHASTFDVTKRLPSFAGPLMQKELTHLQSVLDPQKPFTAVVAGAKYDTKIGPLTALYEKVDHLILGGVIYNTYLAAKYGIQVAGVESEDIEAARELVEKDRQAGKIVEPPVLIESDSLEAREEGRYRKIGRDDFQEGRQFQYILDVAPESFDDPKVKQALSGAKTIFVNAVMGLTPPFWEGSQRFFQAVADNKDAFKLLGGGDTLQEFRNLCPGPYMDAVDDPGFYFFTGGGTVLTAIEQGSPYGLPTVEALMDNGGRPPK